MWQSIKTILMRLFGVKPQSDGYYKRSAEWALAYENAEEINFTAIFASKLSSLAVTDSDVNVDGDNRRAAYIGDVLKATHAKAQKIVSSALGYGGAALVPCLLNGGLYVDIVPSGRFFVIEKSGDAIKKAIMLSDYNVCNSRKYARWTEYTLEDGACVIRNKATVDGAPFDLGALPEWEGIAPEISVPGADQLLLGYMLCPIDNRRPDCLSGVPITYGCDKIIAQIQTTLEEEADEFRLKRAFVGVDSTFFGKDDRLPKSGLFKLFDSTGGDLWREYSPEIRSAAYSARVQELFELLEKAVGTSKGILTAPEAATTATEVRRAQHDTFALVGNIRAAYKAAISELAQAVDILCNYYNLTPPGEYSIAFDFDQSMLEDTAETWQQLKDGRSMGLRSKAELRAWQTGETLAEAQAAVDEIEQNEPVISDLINA
ncbi:MAG: hypothetical protein IJU41_03580 [Clostridia bacterium]|nr:hypothetical protein [Clostridia bacterium]